MLKIKIISCVCFCSYIIFKIPHVYTIILHRQATDHCRTMTLSPVLKVKNMMKLEQLLLKFIPIKYVSFVHIYMEPHLDGWEGKVPLSPWENQPDDM